jgi:hypothetical protein
LTAADKKLMHSRMRVLCMHVLIKITTATLIMVTTMIMISGIVQSSFIHAKLTPSTKCFTLRGKGKVVPVLN